MNAYVIKELVFYVEKRKCYEKDNWALFCAYNNERWAMVEWGSEPIQSTIDHEIETIKRAMEFATTYLIKLDSICIKTKFKDYLNS